MMLFLAKIRRISMDHKINRASKNDMNLSHLISEQEWDSVELMLADSTTFSRHSVDRSARVGSLAVDCILHHACHFNAPLRIIRRLATIFPSSPNTANSRGRYPIRIAVAGGCQPDVIQFLMQVNHQVVRLQDESGKNPIHYAADCYAQNFSDNNFDVPNHHEVYRNTLQVVEYLVKAAPESVNVEDNDEMNPIEYALINGCHIKIVKTLQRASRKDWRRQSTEENESSTSTIIEQDSSNSDNDSLNSKVVVDLKPSAAVVQKDTSLPLVGKTRAFFRSRCVVACSA